MNNPSQISPEAREAVERISWFIHNVRRGLTDEEDKESYQIFVQDALDKQSAAHAKEIAKYEEVVKLAHDLVKAYGDNDCGCLSCELEKALQNLKVK